MTARAVDEHASPLEGAATITPGAEWIYRAQDRGRSQRVRVIGPNRSGSTLRMDVEFLDGDRAGQRRLVGLRRLKGPWAEVEAFEALDRKRRRIEDSFDPWTPMHGAALEAVEHLVPEEVAGPREWCGRFLVHDREALASLCGVAFDDLTTEEDSIESKEGLEIGASSVVRVARAACAANPERMASLLLVRDRHLLLASTPSHHGGDWEARVTELLHDWCGTPPLSLRMLLMALENEMSWQRALVGAGVDALRRAGARTAADNLERLSRDGPAEEPDPDEEDHEDWDPVPYEVPW